MQSRTLVKLLVSDRPNLIHDMPDHEPIPEHKLGVSACCLQKKIYTILRMMLLVCAVAVARSALRALHEWLAALTGEAEL